MIPKYRLSGFLLTAIFLNNGQITILATRDTQFGKELALVMQTTHAQR